MPYFVVILEAIPGVQPTQEQRQSHLNHLASLRSRGILHAAGRFKDGTGGLYILEAKDMEEAKNTAWSDPYVKLGLRKCSVKEWERAY
ncbi:MAG: YciI family protein [Nitrososphaerota archaeon]|nr:YciI family protein [Nitrososphaerota archaeon]